MSLGRPLARLALASTGAAIALSLVFGCSKPPPPEPPPEPKEEWSAPPPPPPKPKKCESMADDCVAKEDTKAKITKSALVFTPVKGWKYATTDDGTVAQPFEIGSALAITTFDVDPKKDKEAKEAALDSLAKQLSLTLPKKKINWRDTSHKRPIGGVDSLLWQMDKVKRADKEGALLVVLMPLADSRSLLAVGFVPDDDKTGADEAIMTAFDSIAPGGGADAKTDKGAGAP